MNTRDYFRIISSIGRVLHVEIKGFISDEIIDDIKEPILNEFNHAIFAFGGKPWIILVDMREFRPTSKKGRQLLSAMMKRSQENGLYHAVEIVPSALTRLSLHSSANSAGFESFSIVESMDEALRVVADKQKTLHAGK